MGLLGNGWDDPQSQAIMALSGGLLSANGSQGLGAGLLGASQAMQAAKAQALKEQMLKMQMDAMQAETESRRARDAQERAAMEQAARVRQSIPGLFGGGMAPGAFAPSADGMGPTMPRSEAPQAGGLDVRRALELGLDPKMIQELAGLSNIGRPKATRQMEVDDGKGGKRIALVDDFGNEVAGFAGYTAPVQVNRGDRVDFVKPAPGVSLGVNMSPGERDSSARGWAGHNLAQQRFALDQGNAVADAGGPNQIGLVRQFGKPPKDYRWKPDGTTEAIPGGPADIKAGELGAKTKNRAEHAVGQANVVIGAIDEALGKAGFFETGLTGAVMGSIPGTQAYDLRGTVDTVKANIGFDSLQKMREMSPTGGALGQVAVQELNMLQSTVSNMNPNQSQAVLTANLEKAKKHYENWKRIMEKAGGLEPSDNGGATGGWGIKKVN